MSAQEGSPASGSNESLALAVRSQMHRWLIGALQHVVASSFSFTCLSLTRAGPCSFIRYRRGGARSVVRQWVPDLSSVLSQDCSAFQGVERRAYQLSEFGSRAWVEGEYELLEANGHVLVVVLRSEDSLYGVLGLERTADEPAFSDEERDHVEELSEMLSSTVGVWLKIEEMAFENAVVRTLGPGVGLSLLADEEVHSVLWVAHDDGLFSEENAALVVRDALDAARNRPGDGACVTECEVDGAAGPVVVTSARVGMAELDMDRCMAIRVRPAVAQNGLSPREQEVSRLLVDGYANLNIAAILGLSENTVRTYIRRLYRKVGVCNRIELVRAMSRHR